MEKFKVTYFFDTRLSVAQVIEAESKENVIKNLAEEGYLAFTDDKDIFHKFKMEDVKLVNVQPLVSNLY